MMTTTTITSIKVNPRTRSLDEMALDTGWPLENDMSHIVTIVSEYQTIHPHLEAFHPGRPHRQAKSVNHSTQAQTRRFTSQIFLVPLGQGDRMCPHDRVGLAPSPMGGRGLGRGCAVSATFHRTT
jgi:hypothetical protein